MLTLCIVCLILGGFLLLSRLSLSLSLAERLGFAFPVGLACVTMLMMLMDWTGAGFGRGSLVAVSVALPVAGYALLHTRRRELLRSLRPQVHLGAANALWLGLALAAVYMLYMNWTKCMYFPTNDRDSMAGFDTIGFIAAQEGTYAGMSVFQGDYMPLIHRPGSVIGYMPMLQLAYAYVYSLGAATSKLVPALFYVSFILGFYGLVRRACNPTAAMVAVLGVLFTPEMTSFSSLSGTNVVQAAMASTGLLYICLWYRKKDMMLLALGSVLLAINCFLRLEGVVFVLAAGLLVLIEAVRSKRWLLLALPAAALLPLLVFKCYAATRGLSSEAAFIMQPFWDADKARQIADSAWGLLTNANFYGYMFHALALGVVATLVATVCRKESPATMLTIALAWVLYFWVLYQVDYKWDSLNNVLAYSAKRYMFCYVPMVWYLLATCWAGRWLLGRVEALCGWHGGDTKTNETFSQSKTNKQ